MILGEVLKATSTFSIEPRVCNSFLDRIRDLQTGSSLEVLEKRYYRSSIGFAGSER
jgi:hypothetical protein